VCDGEFMVFVGPSGCGKSTLMRMIAGLEDITAGELRIGARDATGLPPVERGVAMVFQSYALYPHMTVAQNMGFGLRIAGAGKAAIAGQVKRAADILQIAPLLDRLPSALSGGQRQRVAIGRAIVRKPAVFLFDEPLSNLDASLRVQMRVELGRLHRALGATMIYVTHDQVEAMTLGDRIAVFNGGRIEQVGAPMDLYESPANEFVARFLGSPRMNIVPADVAGGQLRVPGLQPLPLPALDAAQRCTRAGVRPESLQVSSGGEGWRLRITLIEHLGDTTLVHAGLPGSDDTLCARLPVARCGLAAGEYAHFRPLPGALHLFDAQGARLGGA
jgi:multiple sugar transport system ATP-binding protein